MLYQLSHVRMHSLPRGTCAPSARRASQNFSRSCPAIKLGPGHIWVCRAVRPRALAAGRVLDEPRVGTIRWGSKYDRGTLRS
jgi:hypothetical protein